MMNTKKATPNGVAFRIRPERLELPTFWFVARRSNPLSYGRLTRSGLPYLVESNYKTLPSRVAGRQGFEPWNGSYTVNRLAGGPNRPLWHLPEEDTS
jgi:hypothetical protein